MTRAASGGARAVSGGLTQLFEASVTLPDLSQHHFLHEIRWQSAHPALDHFAMDALSLPEKLSLVYRFLGLRTRLPMLTCSSR
jgi:hypothetical protein